MSYYERKVSTRDRITVGEEARRNKSSNRRYGSCTALFSLRVWLYLLSHAPELLTDRFVQKYVSS